MPSSLSLLDPRGLLGKAIPRLTLVFTLAFASVPKAVAQVPREERSLQEVFWTDLVYTQERGEIQLTTGMRARCRELKAAAHLLKPVQKSELRDAIARVLGVREPTGAVQPKIGVCLQARKHPAVHLRVLLAEDNPVNQLLVQRLLEKRGHSVVVASTGLEALDILQRENVDVVVMDIQMPEMDGLEATKAIRSRESDGRPRIPVIALTAHAMKGDREIHGATGRVNENARTS